MAHFRYAGTGVSLPAESRELALKRFELLRPYLDIWMACSPYAPL